MKSKIGRKVVKNGAFEATFSPINRAHQELFIAENTFIFGHILIIFNSWIFIFCLYMYFFRPAYSQR